MLGDVTLAPAVDGLDRRLDFLVSKAAVHILALSPLVIFAGGF
jgi:hypothetical protein